MARAMKDSGIEWVGEVPQNWRVLRNKDFLRNKSVKNYPNEEVLSLYREYGVIPKNSRNDNHNVTSEDTSSYKLVEKNDLVINKMKAWQGSMGISEYRGIISPAYYICSIISEELVPKFIHYAVRNNAYLSEYRRLSSGMRVGQWDLNIKDFLNIKTSLPPKFEQQKIATFLGEKTAHIDSIISKTKESIEAFKAYKQALITETVTKGLNPDAKMKDSGIEWIGEIPERWELTKFKYEIYTRGRLGWKGLTADEYVSEGKMFLATPNIKGAEIDFVNVNYITDERYQESPEIMLSEGDVLLTKDGSTLGTVNVVRFLPGEATVNSSIAVLTPSAKLNSLYLYHYIKSSYIQNVVNRKKDGMGVPHLFQKDIKEFNLLLPELKEQQQIAAFLDEKTAHIDFLIANKEKIVQELEAYKKAMIYEYVTGKKEVE